MPICLRCKSETYVINPSIGLCMSCQQALGLDDPEEAIEDPDMLRERKVAEAAHIILTTETAHNLPVAERLDIVTAEVVIGMHLFKDIASAWRDTFGGRSNVMQEGLRSARKTALNELRLEAHALGASAVVGVDLDYSEISGGGKSMLFLVASGRDYPKFCALTW
ncbi:YbjQ family protein [Ruixingdingia sedimenti]|uniref:YbjQ family protein n=1 Tax=Ruixingdingia sedimenti TaxID=3073604 RepID=A0ABU1FF32_9RHOB|nr:YbjQ family protein [Xinfangfangia sp. LG-4]MDR5655518.1 YbjQ family protein [Xinfangfangia sp. LG-4]